VRQRRAQPLQECHAVVIGRVRSYKQGGGSAAAARAMQHPNSA